MRSRLCATAPVAVTTGLLGAAATVWLAVFADRSSDGPAIVAALAILVVLPALLSAMVVVLVGMRDRLKGGVVVLAVAATGSAAAGFGAGVFVGDDQSVPAFIYWVAESTPYTYLVAVIASLLCPWLLLQSLRALPRAFVAVPTAVIAHVMLGLVLVQGALLVVLLSVTVPAAVLLLCMVTSRKDLAPDPQSRSGALGERCGEGLGALARVRISASGGMTSQQQVSETFLEQGEGAVISCAARFHLCGSRPCPAERNARRRLPRPRAQCMKTSPTPRKVRRPCGSRTCVIGHDRAAVILG